MFDRKAYRYDVTVQGADGSVHTRPVSSHWSPSHDGTPEAIGHAGAAAAFMDSGKQVKYSPVKVERVST